MFRLVGLVLLLVLLVGHMELLLGVVRLLPPVDSDSGSCSCSDNGSDSDNDLRFLGVLLLLLLQPLLLPLLPSLL